MFKTEPLYPNVDESSSDPSLWQQLVTFFSRLWSPQSQEAEQLGWAYTYDAGGTLLAETGSGGAHSVGATQHIWLPTPQGPQPVAAIINGSRYAVHADHLNTPRRLSNEQGQPAWQWPYSAFGEEPAAELAQVRYSLRYPGQYFDGESGLHYNYFRSYDGRTGRYTQPDPIGLEGGWNRFGYAENVPLMLIDSLGLSSLLDPVGEAKTVMRPDGKRRQITSCEMKVSQAVASGDVAELTLALAACYGLPETQTTKLVEICERQNTSINKLLQGTGKIKDLRSNPNLKGVDVDKLLNGSLKDLRSMKLTGKQMDPIRKALDQARDLSGRKGGGNL